MDHLRDAAAVREVKSILRSIADTVEAQTQAELEAVQAGLLKAGLPLSRVCQLTLVQFAACHLRALANTVGVTADGAYKAALAQELVKVVMR